MSALIWGLIIIIIFIILSLLTLEIGGKNVVKSKLGIEQ